MNSAEAVQHLRNILNAVNPDLPGQVRSTHQRVLGEVTSRGQMIDGGAVGLLVSAFQQLIHDTVRRGLAEAKRVFSIPGMPTDEMTKAYVKGFVWGQASTIIGEADRFLSRLITDHRIFTPGSIEPSVKHYEAVCMTEIDLLFESVRNSANTQRFFASGQWFDANTALRGIFETAQKSIDIIDPYIGNRLFVLLTVKRDGVAVRLLFCEALKPADKQALEDFCRQFPSTLVRKLASVLHDRFIIIDSTVVYSAGHSLKDLGSKDTVLTLSPDPANIVQSFEQRWVAATDWP
jgi:hypothetical protein